MWARTQDRYQYILCYPIHLPFSGEGGWVAYKNKIDSPVLPSAPFPRCSCVALDPLPGPSVWSKILSLEGEDESQPWTRSASRVRPACPPSPYKISGSEIAESCVALFLTSWGIYILFSVVVVPIYIPTNSAEGFPFLYILKDICYVLSF